MPKVYIHEVVEVDGTQRARYQHHMTANWVPEGSAERRQRCFGVFTLVGSTGPWPRVVNLWEYDSWRTWATPSRWSCRRPGTGIRPSRSGGSERPRSAGAARTWCWWATTRTRVSSTGSRSGGPGRPATCTRWSPPAWAARSAADEMASATAARMADLGIRLVGLWLVAMGAGDRVVALWAVPDWDTWARHESASASGAPERLPGLTSLQRWLLVDAELSPLRTGRQPTASDRRPLEEL
ncbi:MAG: NIPSNAP family protein [Microthrixaceae bacterium]